MRHSNKERDNVAESRPGSNTELIINMMMKYCPAFFVWLKGRASFQLFKKGRASPKRGRALRPAKTA